MRFKELWLRLSALALAVSMICVLTGCDDVGYDWEAADERRSQLYHTSLDTENKVDISSIGETDLTLPYTADDDFNPYTCQSTLTKNICGLLYDSMIQINPDYEVEYVIAKSIKVDHTIITVQIRSGIVFSNGDPLTSDDISYSFFLATRKESCYYEQLKNVISCSAKGMTVTFVTQTENVNSYKLLDFPIVHFDQKANKNLPPVGSGRFKFATMSDGVTPNKTLLVRNDKWYNPDKVSIETISLRELPTVESIIHSIEIGTVSYMYTDMRDGTPKSVNANFRKVDINHLIYLGINTNDTALADENVRHAISYAISTNEVAAAGFGGMAVGATGPFTPGWREAARYQTGNGRSSISLARDALDQSGYVLINNGIREDQSGKQLSFNLLVCRKNARHMAAAESIKNQLARVGINVDITEISGNGLITRVAEGKYHLYLAEYSLLNDMDIGKLFTPEEGLYNGPLPYDSVRTYTNYRLGLGQIDEFITAFESELPFIPLCYRSGMAVFARSIEGVGEISEDQLFYNMQNWKVTKTGPSS